MLSSAAWMLLPMWLLQMRIAHDMSDQCGCDAEICLSRAYHGNDTCIHHYVLWKMHVLKLAKIFLIRYIVCT